MALLEEDYKSYGVHLKGSLASEDKNTTGTMGLSYSHDQVLSAQDQWKKNTFGFEVGLTQVLSPKDIAQLTVTQMFGKGYFTDPYRLLDSRPDKRNQTAAQVSWNHHFPGVNATSKLSYRLYLESYKIASHTKTAEYAQEFGDGWVMTPLLRYYTQKATDFYRDPVYDAQGQIVFPQAGMTADQVGSVLFTTDRRLWAFGGIPAGIGLSKQITPDLGVRLHYETMRQKSSYRLGSGSPGLAPFYSNMFEHSMTYRW